jgi:hypothetical protein
VLKRKAHNFQDVMICDVARTFQCQFILRKNKFQSASAFALSAGVDPGDHPLFSSLMQIKQALLNSIRLEKTESERRRCSRQKNKFHTSQDEIRSASKSARETTGRERERYSWHRRLGTQSACVLLATARAAHPFARHRRRCRRMVAGLKIALDTSAAWHVAKKHRTGGHSPPGFASSAFGPVCFY